MRIAQALVCGMGCICASFPRASADVFTTYDMDEWLAMVGQVTVLDFTGIGDNVYVTDQYAELGAVFTDGDDFVLWFDPVTYPNDGYGCISQSWDYPSPIVIEFATPQYWLAADTPGWMYVRLYSGGEQIHFQCVPPEPGLSFVGLVSTAPFDEVHFEDPAGPPWTVSIDDLYFGPRMPGDANGDTVVNIDDLVAVIVAWGECPAEGPCAADVTEDGHVGVADLLEVVLSWE